MLLGQIYFYVLAAMALGGALVTVTNKNPIRGAMGLLLNIVSLAGLYLALHAEFLAIIQLIVYAGAIVVLFIFVIMLLGPNASTVSDRRGRITRIASGGLFALAALGGMALVANKVKFPRLGRTEHDFGTIDGMGRTLFSDGVVPFELVSILLIVAIIGAVAVARGRQGDPGASAPEGSLPGGRHPVAATAASNERSAS